VGQVGSGPPRGFGEGGQDRRPHRIGWLGSINGRQDTAIPVVVDDGLGLGVEPTQALPDHLGVAVVGPAGGGALGEPVSGLVVGQREQDDRLGEPGRLEGVGPLCLGDCAREPLEDVAVGTAVGERVGHHRGDDVVGRQLTPVEVGGDLASQLGTRVDVPAEQVPARDVGHAEMPCQGGGLRALPCARGSEQYQSHEAPR
jgi:hypothetical protein